MNMNATAAGRTVFAIACAALVGAMTLSAANPQGIKAQAGPTGDPARDINLLRQQVARLETRLAELEKEELEKFKAADLEAEARDNKFEQRLALLEKAQNDRSAPATTGPVADGPVTMRTITAALEKRTAALEQKLAGPLTVKAPFRVVDAAGKIVMDAGMSADGNPNLVIGPRTAGSVEIGVTGLGDGFVRVGTESGGPGVGIGRTKALGMGVHVYGSDGQKVEGSLALGTTGKGSLAVGDDQGGGARIGVGKSGAGFLAVLRTDGQLGVSAGQLDGATFSVGVYGENETELVALKTGPFGGSVMAMSPKGVRVAALLGGETGGGLALTGPAGGKSAVSISVEASGGKVRVFPAAGGKAHAELTAESSGGAVTLYSSNGSPSASLGTSATGAGAMELIRGGVVYVEAGILPNGRGTVRAGPAIGGPPVGGLGFADRIVGKIQ